MLHLIIVQVCFITVLYISPMYAFRWDFLTRDKKNNTNATNAALTNHGDAFCKQTMKVGMSVMSLKSNWSDYDVHVIKSKFIPELINISISTFC